MISRGTHSCERSCSITLPSGEYDVTYRLEGKCYSDPGKLSGPPEDCYPPEQEAEVSLVEIVEVSNMSGIITVPAGLLLQLSLEINKLPLDDYLFESWAESGYE